ncbi:MAG: DUF1015 domain-containing protein [Peptococcia bacterium]
MSEIRGLVGLRPVDNEAMVRISVPPYDVIKPGSKLEEVLRDNPSSLYHITLGNFPEVSLSELIDREELIKDDVASFYIYEQQYGQVTRTGVLTATKVTPYEEGKIIRHEKTFDDKVKGRLELRRKTGYTFEPVFLLTKAPLDNLLQEIKAKYQPLYQFTSNFQANSELHGIRNRVFRVEEDSQEGALLKEMISQGPLYIADGHHRYHASLLNKQTHCLAYICETKEAKIQAYNRVVKGIVPFEKIRDRLPLVETEEFRTPPKHHFALYSAQGAYHLKAQSVPETDPVARLDCSILERELYPLLGLNKQMITDSRYFDYYPEQDLKKMCQVVDEGQYDLAIALHPVSSEELLAVADAGIVDTDIVMPEKSTFFAPKILSGIVIYKHTID